MKCSNNHRIIYCDFSVPCYENKFGDRKGIFFFSYKDRFSMIDYLHWYGNIADVEGNNLILTAKYSLVNSVEQLPADISQISCHSVVHVSMFVFLL